MFLSSFQILCRKTKDSPLVLNKPAVFAPAGNNSNFQSPPTGQPNPNVRRSSRLFGNSNSVKVRQQSSPNLLNVLWWWIGVVLIPRNYTIKILEMPHSKHCSHFMGNFGEISSPPICQVTTTNLLKIYIQPVYTFGKILRCWINIFTYVALAVVE